MLYEGQICRPPMERASFMLPVAVGCSYNQCTFCTLFKHLKYRQLPLEQVEQEIQRVKGLGGNPKQVFLGDGNAFGLTTDHLLTVLKSVGSAFPQCTAVNMDATITNISRKSDDELRQLKEAGVHCLYLGIESGLDDVLAFTKKDHTLDQAYRQIERLHAAGLTYGAHIMTGIAGHSRGLENAEKTAEFFNRTNPQRIVNFSLFVHRSAPLYQDVLSGAFTPATELENLKEERRLLELLNCGPLSYDGFHDFLSFRVRGDLPSHKEKMLQNLDEAIAHWETQEPVVAYME